MQVVLEGIAPPTDRPEQVTAPLSISVFEPPLVPMDRTRNAGAGAPFGPAGRVSVSVSVSPRVIGSGPVLVTETVQTTRPPAFTVGAETDFATLNVYRHGTQVNAMEPVAPGRAPEPALGMAVPDTDVGADTATVGDVPRTKLEPPPPPPPIAESPLVEAPPPPPVNPAPPPPAESVPVSMPPLPPAPAAVPAKPFSLALMLLTPPVPPTAVWPP